MHPYREEALVFAGVALMRGEHHHKYGAMAPWEGALLGQSQRGRSDGAAAGGNRLAGKVLTWLAQLPFLSAEDLALLTGQPLSAMEAELRVMNRNGWTEWSLPSFLPDFLIRPRLRCPSSVTGMGIDRLTNLNRAKSRETTPTDGISSMLLVTKTGIDPRCAAPILAGINSQD